MTACSDQLSLIQALIDGELDAANSVAIETHLRGCAACAAELERIEAARTMLAGATLRHPAPELLRARIEAMAGSAFPAKLASTPPHRGTAMSAARSWGGGLAMGLAASLVLILAFPQFTRVNTEDQLVANHVRSLSLASHLTDIATSDRHVVKPWFNGRIDFAPSVPELKMQGFPLVGGRLDYVDGHEVPAIVYKRRLHTINVFIQPAPTLSLPIAIAAKHEGYSLVRWTNGGLEYWAVSDIDLGDLKLFQRSFVAQPSL